MPPTTPLDATAWVDAAYEAFAAGGLDAVRVEAVARTLGATKGSFYWHFADRQALVDAVLEHWEAETEEIVAAVTAAPGSPAEHLAVLFDAVTRRRTPRTGEQLLYAQTDRPGVAAVLERVTARRLATVAALLEDAGRSPQDARARAAIALATVVGAEHLALATPGLLPRGPAARDLAALSLAMVLGTDTTVESAAAPPARPRSTAGDLRPYQDR